MMTMKKKPQFKYPGTRMAMDGNTAVIMCEREASDAAGAYPITPSTQMGEYWAVEVSKGHTNTSDQPLIFVEPESEHAAAAVTAGMAMTGLRATNFSSAQGIAFMHESLYAAAGKRLPYVLNIGCRAITKASLNVHCGHDDYHCIDDTGFFQLFANNAQGAADLNLIGRRIAELSLTPAAVGQDGFLTTHLIEPVQVPERELIAEYLGKPSDIIECPTPAQKMIYGETRRRVPEVWDVDKPMQSGTVQNQDAYMQSVAAQRPYFFDHIRDFTEQAMDEFYELTGRRYHRVSGYKLDDADYVIAGQGSLIVQAQAIVDYLRKTRKIKVGVLDMTMYRPFPGDLVGRLLKGKKGVVVLERTDQPLAEDLPLMREIRASMTKCMENNVPKDEEKPWPDYETWKSASDRPNLYSGCFGLGSRDLQPGDLIGAVENMLPDGDKKRFFYLSIDFIPEKAANPKQEIHVQNMLDAYPDINKLSVKGSENPDLLPEGAITARIHSVGGWGAITTGKNLAMTLYDLLGYDIRANPKYGSEKKGQPTTYYLSAAPEPIRLNCEYHHVDVVLAPDPNVFGHSNPLYGLKPNGVFVIQSNLDDADALWATFSDQARNFIVNNNIRVFYVDGFKIAREEATNADLEFRMQGTAFQGAFFAASPLMEKAGLDEEGLLEAIRKQLQDKFGHKGERVVEDNMRVVRRGFDESHEIINKSLDIEISATQKDKSKLPIMLKQLPGGDGLVSDVHRFWEQTGSFYVAGKGNDNLTDPLMATSLLPAATGIYRDMTNIRFEYPEFIPENCTACGDCYSQCPDSAIPGLVNSVSEIFGSVINGIERKGQLTKHLRRETRTVEKKLHAHIGTQGEQANITQLLDQSILETLAEADEGKRESMEAEFGLFSQALGDFRFSVTKPYFTTREKKNKGSGGLFSVTINPYTCKGCMLCVDVCTDDALRPVAQTEMSIQKLRDEWEFWLDLPNTKPDYIRIDDLDEKVGALDTLLLDKRNYSSMVCGDGACLGCGEKTAIHLFTSTVSALMQPRIKAHLEEIDDLVQRLETHIRLKLAEGVDLTDTGVINDIVSSHKDTDLTLSELSSGLDEENRASPVDTQWLQWATGLLESLRDLKWKYTEGQTRQGRADMGMINATGCTSVWGSTFPYNPYPFPWTNNLFQDSPSMAMGIFEGHMKKMIRGFKAIRQAKLELEGKFNPEEHDEFFTHFGWKQLSDEEWKLCPPVVAVGGDGAMYDIGFQNLSRALASGMPIKVMVVDTQVYSNTGGQACTSGFIGQVSDMAPYGKEWRGKEEIRKEISLIGMAHRTSFILQSSVSHLTHIIEGYIDGLNSRRPALFNIYTVCPPEHGVADDASEHQSRMAVESRAYPLFRFDPDAGITFTECAELEGNPSIEDDWMTYKLDYLDEAGQEASMELPLTFADFALTEGRFQKQFRKAPQETWNDDMTPLHEFLDLEEDDRDGLFPYIWAVDKKNRLMRVLVSAEMVNSCKERRDFWQQLKSLVGMDEPAVDIEAVTAQAKADMAQKLSSTLLSLSSSGDISSITSAASTGGNGASAPAAGGNGAAPGGWEPVWIESPECTTCDECIEINPKIFAYDENDIAYVLDPKGGPFKDIVKAAEKCTAGCLHPGTPYNPNEKGLDKFIKRAEKYQ